MNASCRLLIVLVALGTAVAGCRPASSVSRPDTQMGIGWKFQRDVMTDPPTDPPEDDPGMPVFHHWTSALENGAVVIRSTVDGGGRFGYPNGDWIFNVFVNTDRMPTGYAHAYEFVALGWAPGYPVCRAEAGSSPGGWGEVTGAATITVANRQLVVRIPLTALGPDDGDCEWAFELYTGQGAFVLDIYGSVSLPYAGDAQGSGPGAPGERLPLDVRR